VYINDQGQAQEKNNAEIQFNIGGENKSTAKNIPYVPPDNLSKLDKSSMSNEGEVRIFIKKNNFMEQVNEVSNQSQGISKFGGDKGEEEIKKDTGKEGCLEPKRRHRDLHFEGSLNLLPHSSTNQFQFRDLEIKMALKEVNKIDSYWKYVSAFVFCNNKLGKIYDRYQRMFDSVISFKKLIKLRYRIADEKDERDAISQMSMSELEEEQK